MGKKGGMEVRDTGEEKRRKGYKREEREGKDIGKGGI